MRRASGLTLASVFMVITHTAAASELLTRPQAYALAGSDRAQASVAAMKGFASTGGTDVLVAELKKIALRSDLSAVEKERVAHDGLRYLSNLAPNDAAWDLLNDLATSIPTTYVEHDEGRGRAVPLYDVGALARSIKHHWLTEQAKNRALARIMAADPAVLHIYDPIRIATNDEINRSGVQRSFEEAPVQALLAYRGDILNRLAAGQDVELIAVNMARRLADKQMFIALTTHASTGVAVRMLASVTNAVPAADAYDILSAAANRSDIASAALLAMVPLAGSTPSATDYLFSELGNPFRGASAAAALARIGDTITIRRLGLIVASGKDGTVERQAMLALRLNNSPAAGDEIRDFLADPGASAKLRAEVSQWQAD